VEGKEETGVRQSCRPGAIHAWALALSLEGAAISKPSGHNSEPEAAQAVVDHDADAEQSPLTSTSPSVNCKPRSRSCHEPSPMRSWPASAPTHDVVKPEVKDRQHQDRLHRRNIYATAFDTKPGVPLSPWTPQRPEAKAGATRKLGVPVPRLTTSCSTECQNCELRLVSPV
jgi:hypothetical protein